MALSGRAKDAMTSIENASKLLKDQQETWSVLKGTTENDWLSDAAVVAADELAKKGELPSPDPDNETHTDAMIKLSPHKSGSNERMVIREIFKEMFGSQIVRAASAVKKVVAEKLTKLEELERDTLDEDTIEKLKKEPWFIRAGQMAVKFWEQPETVIQNAQIDGKIYQFNQAKWWGYDYSARAIRVSDYQFRAPLEWFAEVYAVFKLKKLATTHPCFTLIDGIVAKQVKQATI
jgi:hypothetical protein